MILCITLDLIAVSVIAGFILLARSRWLIPGQPSRPRSPRRAAVAPGHREDGKPLSNRDRLILAQIEADSRIGIPEPEYPRERS